MKETCCPTCFVYITAVNEHRESMGLGTWVIGTSHQQMYNWQCVPSIINGNIDRALEAGAKQLIASNT